MSNPREQLEKLEKEYDEDIERKFKKTKKILKILERIMKIAEKEKWSLNYLIEELEYDIGLWRENYYI